MPRYNNENDFWNKVDIRSEDECWLWQGSMTPKGYGRFHLNGKEIRSHVQAFKFVHGEPSNQIMHDCMNKLCCNPNHLFDGTTAENHHYPDTAKLTWELVKLIRHISYVSGFGAYKVSKLIHFHPNTIRDVIKKRTWI